MKAHVRMLSIALAGVMGVSMWAAPQMAQASEAGRKNTALLLGAASAYLLLTQHNKLPGLITAAGALVAYNRYEGAIRARHRWEYGYWNRDNNNYRDHYTYHSYQQHWGGRHIAYDRHDYHNQDHGRYQRDGHWDHGWRNGKGERYHNNGRGDQHH